MFNVNSIATYIQQPDLINIELTEAIWSELGWSRKEECVRKIESELIEGTDYNAEVLRKFAGNSEGRPSKTFSLSYNGLKILAASTTKALIKAFDSIDQKIPSIKTGATGRYASGTYIHPVLAIALAEWLSPEFSVYVKQTFIRFLEGDIMDKRNARGNKETTACSKKAADRVGDAFEAALSE